MAEQTQAAPVVEQPPAAAPPTPDTTTIKFAGKFTDENALADGIRNAHKVLGLPDPGSVIGKGGIAENAIEAEAYYKGLDRQIARRQDKPKADAPAKSDAPLSLGEADKPQVDKPAINGAELLSKFESKGQLDPADYDNLVKAGYPREIVDDYLATKVDNRKRQSAEIRSEAAKIAGSDELLNTLLSTATQYVPPGEMEDINARLKDPKLFRGAIRDLKAMYESKQGQLLGGGPNPSMGGKINNAAEFSAVMTRVLRGDPEAVKIVENTPMEQIRKWSNF